MGSVNYFIDFMISLFITIFYGVIHSFEADHILAVAGLVTNKKNFRSAIKDGVMWGIGHSFTILIFGVLAIIFSITFPENFFSFFEAIVGLVLILIGFSRLFTFFFKNQEFSNSSNNKAAFSTGIIHGLAGSGSLLIILLPEAHSQADSLFSITLFGIGTVAGMAIASALCFLPYARKNLSKISGIVLLLSSFLCIGYGGTILYNNLSQIFIN